jgi:hypothetical protein
MTFTACVFLARLQQGVGAEFKSCNVCASSRAAAIGNVEAADNFVLQLMEVRNKHSMALAFM